MIFTFLEAALYVFVAFAFTLMYAVPFFLMVTLPEEFTLTTLRFVEE